MMQTKATILGDGPPVSMKCPVGLFYMNTANGDLYYCAGEDWSRITVGMAEPSTPASSTEPASEGLHGVAWVFAVSFVSVFLFITLSKAVHWAIQKADDHANRKYPHQ